MYSFLLKIALLTFLAAIGLMLAISALEKSIQIPYKVIFSFLFIGIGGFNVLIYLLWLTGILNKIPGSIFFWFEPIRKQSGLKAVFFHLFRYAILPIIVGLLILSGRR